MCGDCYRGEGSKGGTQHRQLYNWYLSKYGEKKSFEFASGFAQEANNHLKYNSATLNLDPKYGKLTGERAMNDFEQKILRHVVIYKFKNYQVGPTPCTDRKLFECPNGHPLALVGDTQRRRDTGNKYPDEGFTCDGCDKTFPDGFSWHCSCSPGGFDRCGACVAFDPTNSDMMMTEED